MKLVALIEGSTDNFKKMIDMSKGYKSMFLDTEHCDELHEYNYLLDNINKFKQSGSEIMIAKFSGRETITKNLGDVCSEMIIPISYNKNSKYYIENPTSTFSDLLNLFEKET